MAAINTRIRKTPTSTRPPAAAATTAMKLQPNLIRCRAYEIFLGRNGGPGDAVSDWVQAERELKGTSESPDGPHTGSVAGSPSGRYGILYDAG